MFSTHFPHSPSPSPPSSPPCIDSSPVSSRSSTPVVANDYDMDNDPDVKLLVRTAPPSHVVDPFAASVVSDWIPPEYERRSPGIAKTGKRTRAERVTYDTLSISPESVKKMRYCYRTNHRSASSESILGLGDIDLRIKDVGDRVDVGDTSYKSSRDEQIWEDASTSVFNGNGNIDLSNQNLTYIPRKFIEDMENIYIPPGSLDSFRPPEVPGSASRPFMRSLTAPANIGSSHFLSNARRMVRDRFGRVPTADTSLGLPKGEIALYLTANQITKLPKELFNLQKLTILSLRHNKLTYLPPEIKNLISLHTLNIASNQLQYLPCEMLQMSLSTLAVHPNPFLKPALLALVPEAERLVSQPIRRLPRIIPLVEVCLRELLSPMSNKDDTILATHYDLPLQEFEPHDADLPPLPGRKRINKALPSHLRKVLDACLPGSVYDIEDEKDIHSDEDYIMGLGRCPHPLSSEERANCGAFVRHAEERYTWESKVANVDIGARVPVLWRGCNWGCLDFLDDAIERRTEGNFGADEAVRVMNLDMGAELGFDE